MTTRRLFTLALGLTLSAGLSVSGRAQLAGGPPSLSVGQRLITNGDTFTIANMPRNNDGYDPRISKSGANPQGSGQQGGGGGQPGGGGGQPGGGPPGGSPSELPASDAKTFLSQMVTVSTIGKNGGKQNNNVLVGSGDINTGQGTISTTVGTIATVKVAGGTITVNVLTGKLTFKPTRGSATTISSGSTGQIQGTAVTRVMNTADVVKGGDSALAQVTQDSMLSAVAAVAAIAKAVPNNATVGNLLTNLVTEVTKQAANSGNTALVQNVVAFAVANSSPSQQATITAAANTGIQNSTATAATKATLVADVKTSADAGAKFSTNDAPKTTTVDNKTTVVTSVDPSQVTIVSKSN